MLQGIRHLIAVGSGKGGVGKSTVSVNLALALQQRGARVGLVDADILGPSIPGMLCIPTGEPPEMTADSRMIPAERYGLKVVSMGMLTGDDRPAVLRGPMVGKYLKMFVSGVQWGELDYLILDLPPGTGDTQLTLAQSLPLSGVVIVTTPQAVSLKIARRGLRMFEKVQVPILGIVENMRTFTCPHCGETTDIFRHGGGEQMSQDLGVPFLGALPLDTEVVTCGDEGCPIVVDQPKSPSARVYGTIADALVAQLHTADSVLKPFVWKWDSNDGAPTWTESAVKSYGARNVPVGLLRRDPRTLSILWQDGHRDDLDVRDLRLVCRCALCVEEMSGRKLLDPQTVQADVSPRQITSIGHYAIQFDWSDGHNSGIYAFNDLRELGERATLQGAEDV
jgi:ATP-binding protein involved in chromosome partitioning